MLTLPSLLCRVPAKAQIYSLEGDFATIYNTTYPSSIQIIHNVSIQGVYNS